MPNGEMRRYKLAAFGQPLCEAVDAVPKPQGSEVLLRVAACGICHSDLHLMDGHFDLGGGQKLDLARSMRLPHVLGHEIVGEVVALGPEAEGVAPGDRRLAFPWIGCGTCALCRAGAEHLCNRPRALGVSIDGGFGTHVVVPHPRYLVEMGDLPEDLACTYACSGLTAYSALKKCGALGSGDAALIIGAGGVGLAAVHLAPLTWGIRPIVADVDPAKREAALEAGVAGAIDPSDPDARKRLVRETDGGVAAVIDFVGLPSTAEFGLSVLRKGGRHISVGLFGGSVTLPLPTLAMRGITLTGSYVGSLAELRELVTLLREHGPYPLPVSRKTLDELPGALDDLRAGRIVGRAVVTPGSPP